MTPSKRMPMRLLAGILVAGGLASCSGDGIDQADEDARTDESPADGEDDAGVDESEVDATPTDGAGATPLPSEPVATAAGSGNMAGFVAEVYDLNRSEATLTLRFAIVNDQDARTHTAQFDAVEDEAGDPSYDSMSGVTLTDDRNAKRYLALRDSQGRCVCSTDVARIGEGTNEYFVKFTAPSEGVDVLSVQIPLFGALDGIPVTGG